MKETKSKKKGQHRKMDVALFYLNRQWYESGM